MQYGQGQRDFERGENQLPTASVNALLLSSSSFCSAHLQPSQQPHLLISFGPAEERGGLGGAPGHHQLGAALAACLGSATSTPGLPGPSWEQPRWCNRAGAHPAAPPLPTDIGKPSRLPHGPLHQGGCPMQNVTRISVGKPDLRRFLQQRRCDTGGLTGQTLLNGTRWAAPSNALSLGLRTAMELRILLLLLLCFPGPQAQVYSAQESRSEGSTLSIQCPYREGATYRQQKAWYRLTDNQRELLVETTKPTENSGTTQATKGKVTIEDDPMNRTVVITMTDLQVEDSGTYYCAYYSYKHWYYPLKTISLNVFKELNKHELDRLSVRCPYSTLGYSTGTKAWCRKEGQSECKVVARTDYRSTRRNSRALADRTLIQDNTWNRTVTITMEKLQARDSGVYWCAIYRGSHLMEKMEVRLSVSKRTQQCTAKESGKVSVQCPYSAPDYGAVSKAWCKEGDSPGCRVLVSTSYSRTPQKGRVTIQDDPQQGIVTITMEELQAQDSGVYWCALHEDAHLFRMVEVTLNISDVSAGTTLSGAAGCSQSTPSGNTPPPSSNGNIFNLRYGVLSILFILALIILITLCVWRRKQLKSRGTRQAEDIYEKPEDITQLDSTERMESSKDDSNDLKYVTLNFKSQLSPEDALYCNVEPSQTHSKPEDENVEYAIISLKPLPTNDKG